MFGLRHESWNSKNTKTIINQIRLQWLNSQLTHSIESNNIIWSRKLERILKKK